ncbi:MAG: hypothetical protein ACREJC_18635, partial [Tepidisphaeraceae bacterium]
DYGAIRDATGVFQWTKAVAALCVLALRTSAWDMRAGSTADYPTISGERGSPACSLSDAIDRSTNKWLDHMFGNLRGLMFDRTNAGCKQPGPCYVAINPRTLPPGCIEVFVNKLRITAPEQVEKLAQMVSQGLSPVRG